MVMIMFGYKHVVILLEKVVEILVVLLTYCWFNYGVQLGFWFDVWVVLVNLWLMHLNINIWEAQR